MAPSGKLPLHPAVLPAIAAAAPLGANPASLHAPGRRARRLVEALTGALAGRLGRRDAEVLLVASRAEAALLLLPGLRRDAAPAPQKKQCIATTKAWGDDAAAALAALQHAGHRLMKLGDASGQVEAGALRQALAAGASRIWLPWRAADGQPPLPFAELADLAAAAAVPLVVDVGSAAATPGLPLTLTERASACVVAEDMGGPPGIAAVLLQRGHTLTPLWGGGPQGNGLRPGTEAAALCAGWLAALGGGPPDA